MTTPPIPSFTSPEEEAHYWETHDFSEIWDTARPTTIQRERVFTRSITIRFDETTLARLRQTAKDRGVGPTTLVRMWIKERLDS